jgi:hypothetical protein
MPDTDIRPSRFAGRLAWLLPTVMWCPPLLLVGGLAYGHLPLTQSLWLSWGSLAFVVLIGWMSSMLTIQFVEPTIPPDDLPSLPSWLCLAIVGGFAALLTGTIAAGLDNHAANLYNNPVQGLALLLGMTSAGVSVGISERAGVAEATTHAFTIGTALSLLIFTSMTLFAVFTLVWAVGAVRSSIIFPDKYEFLKPAATRWKTWKHRLEWLLVWLTLILVPAVYLLLIMQCLFGWGLLIRAR